MKIGIVDTTFARVNMGKIAIEQIENEDPTIKIFRRTVPGFKDLAVECKILIEKENLDICLALGMAGGAEIDRQCAHEASMGIMNAKLLTNKHIIEVFVFTNEAKNEKQLFEICKNRTKKHAINAIKLIKDPNWFIKNAGKGLRQGFEDEGEINV